MYQDAQKILQYVNKNGNINKKQEKRKCYGPGAKHITV